MEMRWNRRQFLITRFDSIGISEENTNVFFLPFFLPFFLQSVRSLPGSFAV